MPFQVTNPESIELMRKMVQLQMESTHDTRVVCDALLQMLGMCIVAMAGYNPHVARNLYDTIGDNLTDIIVEELKQHPELTNPQIDLASLRTNDKWKM